MVTGTSERCFWFTRCPRPLKTVQWLSLCDVIPYRNKHRMLHTAFRESARSSYKTTIEKFPLPDIGKLQYVINGKLADLQPLLRCWSTQYNDAALLPLGNRI